jgi:hypothetical protein
MLIGCRENQLAKREISKELAKLGAAGRWPRAKDPNGFGEGTGTGQQAKWERAQTGEEANPFGQRTRVSANEQKQLTKQNVENCSQK